MLNVLYDQEAGDADEDYPRDPVAVPRSLARRHLREMLSESDFNGDDGWTDEYAYLVKPVGIAGRADLVSLAQDIIDLALALDEWPGPSGMEEDWVPLKKMKRKFGALPKDFEGAREGARLMGEYKAAQG